MATKNVKNPRFLYLNHQIEEIYSRQGTVVLPSPKAWEKYKWTHRYFKTVPKEGYFIWVKKQTSLPILTCITISLPHIQQQLNNLLVVEKGITARTEAICQAVTNLLRTNHLSRGKIVLKKDAQLIYHHFHQWGYHDYVQPDYEYYLGENAHLDYLYKVENPPQDLQFKTIIHSGKNSRADLRIIAKANHSHIKIHDEVILEGKQSSGIVRLRLVAEEKSKIEAYSQIAVKKKAAGAKGHLDCQGIIVDKDSSIRLIPELRNENKKALLTHEASIGRIEGDELEYLMSRGLSQKKAIDLIVKGFLK